MSNAVFRPLLPSTYCKHIYFVVSPAFLSCFPPRRPTSRSSAPSPPTTGAASQGDHDRDDGVAESPYMLIQGSARLTNRKNRRRAWRLGKSNRRRSPVLLFTRTCTLGRELIWSISAHSMRARPQDDKGKAGDRSPWEADRFLAHADAESLGEEGLHCVYYEEQKEKTLQRARPDEQQRETGAR